MDRLVVDQMLHGGGQLAGVAGVTVALCCCCWTVVTVVVGHLIGTCGHVVAVELGIVVERCNMAEKKGFHF